MKSNPNPNPNPGDTRRHFLRRTSALASAACLPAWTTLAHAAEAPRGLALVHLHTLERIDLVFANGPETDPAALARFSHFLRDHHSGDAGSIDPLLLDALHRLRVLLDNPSPFEIVSAYRSASTNEHLRRTRDGGVASKSLHMEGRAIDLRLPGTALTELRDAARSLQAGGVGFYPKDGFLHVDTGRVRHW